MKTETTPLSIARAFAIGCIDMNSLDELTAAREAHLAGDLSMADQDIETHTERLDDDTEVRMTRALWLAAINTAIAEKQAA